MASGRRAKMIEELKVCPFCKSKESRAYNHAKTCYFYLKKLGAPPRVVLDAWNTRPIEDALSARIVELEIYIAGLELFKKLHGG
jgi:hypothetical protein